MHKSLCRQAALWLTLWLAGCGQARHTATAPEGRLLLRLDPSAPRQTIHSFGASDCWTTKYIGRWADEEAKNRIADLLFSLDTLPDGSPRGIGLSLWRFNIGAGSYEQGDTSGIASDWRREECFLDAQGRYDWSKQAGARWFLRAARQRGLRYALGFANSPPVYMTRNGRAFSPGGRRLNLRDDAWEAYAGFLARVAEHFRLDYLSPVNEPQWDWKAGANGRAGQEGSPAGNADIARIARLLSDSLQGSACLVVVGEAGRWEYLYARDDDGRGDQVRYFFDPFSAGYIGDQPGVSHIISAHSYFTTCPDTLLHQVRQRAQEAVQAAGSGLQAWMSEFGVLGDICGRYSGAPRHTDMDYGLYVARVIHHDLTVAGVSSWQWWLAVNPYDYSDGLVYINAPSGAIDPGACRSAGLVSGSRQLWVLGNYARFVRPGMQRIPASLSGPGYTGTAPDALLVSAYRDPQRRALVVVAVNPSREDRLLRLDAGRGRTPAGLNRYLTAEGRDLQRSFARADSIAVPARSVVTLTGKY